MGVWERGGTADTPDLGSGIERCESSNLSAPTNFKMCIGVINVQVSRSLLYVSHVVGMHAQG